MNRPIFFSLYFFVYFVDSATQDVKNTSQDTLAYRYRNRCTCVHRFRAAGQTVSRTHRNAADDAVAQVLHNFRHNINGHLTVFIFDFNRVVNGRQLLISTEGNVDHGTNDLDDFSFL